MKRTQSFTRGPWQHMYAVTAICPDGKVRKVRVAQSPDTFFSIRGRTTIAGIPIAGVVMSGPNTIRNAEGKFIDNPDADEYTFTPYRQAKNFARLCAKLGFNANPIGG